MQSKFETLSHVVRYVKENAEHPVAAVDELLSMGFEPCQLVYEFGFDENTVKKSEIYQGWDQKTLDDEEYPYMLDKFNPFDAALVSRFRLSTEQLLRFKSTETYKTLLSYFNEEKEAAITEVINETLDIYEKDLMAFKDEV